MELLLFTFSCFYSQKGTGGSGSPLYQENVILITPTTHFELAIAACRLRPHSRARLQSRKENCPLLTRR